MSDRIAEWIGEAQLGGYRWGWVIFGGRLTAEALSQAVDRYAARFGVSPAVMYCHPDHLAGGLQSPLGVRVEADRRCNPAILEFDLPQNDQRLIGGLSPAAGLSVLAVALPGPSSLSWVDGPAVLAALIVAFVMALAWAKMRRAMR